MYNRIKSKKISGQFFDRNEKQKVPETKSEQKKRNYSVRKRIIQFNQIPRLKRIIQIRLRIRLYEDKKQVFLFG